MDPTSSVAVHLRPLYWGGSYRATTGTRFRARVPVGLARVPFLLVVNPSLPVHSVAELVKLARDRPSRLSFGTGFRHLPSSQCRAVQEHLRIEP
jgi:hypothetical protein